MMISRLLVSLALATVSLGVSLEVDLGYSVYEGVANSTTGLTTFKGIRYAAPPTGSLRWQAPTLPAKNRTSVISAANFGPICPQSFFSIEPFGFNAGVLGDEDCLFLNVYAPTSGTNLPVLVYIHGGGYGYGDGTTDMTSIVTANGNSFIAVTIQYRLGAFGWLSSAEVHNKGVVNAGLLDQHLALEWVQNYICEFGGDPTKVTISGESAGAGSVMLHNMAYGGTLGTSLFVNSITASPYLPAQYNYSDPVPTAHYKAFAAAAGCPAVAPSTFTTFQCLVSKNTTVLQEASFNVSASGEYGTWAFVPVTDGTYVQERPSQQLEAKKLNGLRQLSGNNADEGYLFVIPTIETEADLLSWINETFPEFTTSDTTELLEYYPNTVSYQQTAFDIYGESVFVCPSYWLVEAFSGGSFASYKYQYSVPFALHTTDIGAYFGPPTVNQGPAFVKAFQTIWGNFITKNNPSISNAIAIGASSTSTVATNPASNWPAYTTAAPYMINLNETGGVLTTVTLPFGQGVVAQEYVEPGLKNNITLVNAYTFDSGRGARCDFWRSVSADVPE